MLVHCDHWNGRRSLETDTKVAIIGVVRNYHRTKGMTVICSLASYERLEYLYHLNCYAWAEEWGQCWRKCRQFCESAHLLLRKIERPWLMCKAIGKYKDILSTGIFKFFLSIYTKMAMRYNTYTSEKIYKTSYFYMQTKKV